MSKIINVGVSQGLLLQDAVPIVGRRLIDSQGIEYLDFSTASYLGLEFHERCIETLCRSVRSYGTHSYCSPVFLRPRIQHELEEMLAALSGREDAIVFSNVSLLHAGVLPVVLGKRSTAIVDQYAHQSIYQALKLVHGSVAVARNKHSCVSSIKRDLEQNQSNRGVIICDGIYSMAGDIAPLHEISILARQHDASVYVDDSHGFGAIGLNGRGVVADINCDYVYVASFSKSLACPVAFLAGDRDVVNQLRLHSTTYVFSGNIPVPYLETAKVALEIARGDEGDARRSALAENVTFLRDGLRRAGFVALDGVSGIVAVELRDEVDLRNIACELRRNRIAFHPVTFPAIPKGEYRVRFSVSASHRRCDIEKLLDVMDATPRS